MITIKATILSSPNKTVTFLPRSSSKLAHTSSGTVAVTLEDVSFPVSLSYSFLMYVSSLDFFEKLSSKSVQPSEPAVSLKTICLFSKDLSVAGTSSTIKSSASFK